jgi:hypothetical protein
MSLHSHGEGVFPLEAPSILYLYLELTTTSTYGIIEYGKRLNKPRVTREAVSNSVRVGLIPELKSADLGQDN